MARGRGGGGGSAASSGVVSNGHGFTYDFGIAIAAGGLRQLRLFSGATLELTTAVYALSRVTSEFVDTLKTSQLAFGGQIKTLKTMQWAQQQLLSGATEFNTSDIMTGMRQLQAVGVDAAQNFKFMSSAAHATGQSFTQFSGAVSQAISGNMSGLVQMGLLSERATHTFDKFAANSVQRQQAILNFIKAHKGLAAAIANDFNTISDQWNRVIEGVKMYMQAIMGNPHDPNSLYNRIATAIKGIGDWINRHATAIKKAGALIGTFFGYIVRQIALFGKWVFRQLGKVLDWFDGYMGNFGDRMRSAILWLELWKDHVLKFFSDHRDAIIKWAKILVTIWAVTKALSLLSGAMYALETGGVALKIITPIIERLINPFLHLRYILQTSALWVGRLFTGLKSIGGIIWKVLTEPIIWLGNAFKSVLSLFMGGGGLVGFLARAGALATEIWGTFVSIVSTVGTFLAGISGAVLVIGAIVAAVYLLWKYWDKIWPVVHDIGAILWNVIVISVKEVWKFIKWIWSGFVALWEGALKIGKAIVDWMPDVVKNSIQWAVDKILWLWNKIKGIGSYVSNLVSFGADATAKGAGDFGVKSYAANQALDVSKPNTAATIPGVSNVSTQITPAPDTKTGKVNNPLIPKTPSFAAGPNGMSQDTGGGTVNVQKGAVVINVEKGQNVNEETLARMIQRILPDLIRRTKMQTGS